MMDVTRRVLLSQPPKGKTPAGPNIFDNVPAFPSATDRSVVRPNFDTLYSTAWLDLSKGPVVVSSKDTNGRYYLLREPFFLGAARERDCSLVQRS
jgi:hypothetical protein